MYTGRAYTHPLDGRVEDGSGPRRAEVPVNVLWGMAVALLLGLAAVAVYGWITSTTLYKASVKARSVIEYEPLATTKDEGECADGQCPTRSRVLGKVRAWKQRH